MILGELEVAGRIYDGCTIFGSDKFFCVVGYLDGGRKDPHKYIKRYQFIALNEEHLSSNFKEKILDPGRVFLSYYNVVDEGKFSQKMDIMGGASVIKIMPYSAYCGLVVRGISNVVVDPRYRKRMKFGTMIFGHCTDVASGLYDFPADAVAFGTSNPWVGRITPEGIEGIVHNLNSEPYCYNYVPIGERMRSDGRRKVTEFMTFLHKDDFLEDCKFAKRQCSEVSDLLADSVDSISKFMDSGIYSVSIETLRKQRDFLESFPAAKDIYSAILGNNPTEKVAEFMQYVNENVGPKLRIMNVYHMAKALENEFSFLPKRYQYLLAFLDGLGCKDPRLPTG